MDDQYYLEALAALSSRVTHHFIIDIFQTPPARRDVTLSTPRYLSLLLFFSLQKYVGMEPEENQGAKEN